MMDFRKQVMLATVCAALVVTMVPPAGAGEIDFTRVVRKKDPFKDLPGVKAPIDEPLKFKSACTSSIQRRHWAERPGGTMPVRVYHCENGIITYDSTNPPMEEDWRIYRERSN